MTRINLKLTIQEANLLSSLAADQLFRREFIDPHMPGGRRNPEEIARGKMLVERLQRAAGLMVATKGVPHAV